MRLSVTTHSLLSAIMRANFVCLYSRPSQVHVHSTNILELFLVIRYPDCRMPACIDTMEFILEKTTTKGTAIGKQIPGKHGRTYHVCGTMAASRSGFYVNSENRHHEIKG